MKVVVICAVLCLAVVSLADKKPEEVKPTLLTLQNNFDELKPENSAEKPKENKGVTHGVRPKRQYPYYGGYGYSYPSYGYGYSGYGYPGYGYSGYSYPSYGYSYPSYGYSYPSYGYGYSGYPNSYGYGYGYPYY